MSILSCLLLFWAFGVSSCVLFVVVHLGVSSFVFVCCCCAFWVSSVVLVVFVVHFGCLVLFCLLCFCAFAGV